MEGQIPSSPCHVSERRQGGRRGEDFILLRRDRELEAARRISQHLFQYIEVDELVEAALRAALDEVGAESGSVLLTDREAKQLVFYYSIGEKPVQRGTAIPWDQGIAGAVFQSGDPVIISDVKKNSHHYAGVDSATGLVTRDMITVPLKRWKGDPIGVLNVLNKRNGVLDTHDLDLLMIISAFTALAIEQARLFGEAKKAEIVTLLGDIGHDLKNLLQPIVSGIFILKG
jgi:GAF domain-containing protein